MREVFAQVVSNLRANKLRSFLTMFGILWGIVSIVVLSAMGEGFRRGNDRVLREFGKNQGLLLAGAIAYYALLSVVPLVILVVIALLTLLSSLVRDIEVGVAALWTMAKRMAANTSTTYQLNETASLANGLTDELQLHDEVLANR